MIVTLASASPRRRELIKNIDDLTVTVIPSDADENIAAEAPVDLVEKLAYVKAKSVYDNVGGVVIGADTLVTVLGRVLGKPKTEEEAYEFFKLLCGRTHHVVTGIAVISADKTVITHETTAVTFNAYDEKLVAGYIAGGSPFDKAGGYGIQDEDLAPLIKEISGPLDNVIGLPVELLRKTLEEFN